jgi:hypothetical protein
MKFEYECEFCGEIFEHEKKGTYYCDWIDCENGEPLEYLRTTITALEIAKRSLESIRDFSSDPGSKSAAREALRLMEEEENRGL